MVLYSKFMGVILEKLSEFCLSLCLQYFFLIYIFFSFQSWVEYLFGILRNPPKFELLGALIFILPEYFLLYMASILAFSGSIWT